MHVRNCTPPSPVNDAAPDDEALLERMKLHDDAEAYRLLVERYVDNVYVLALRLLCKSAAAEGVTHDAMIEAWIHRHAWVPGHTKFSIRLYRIVVNSCVDLRRRPAGTDVNDIPDPTDAVLRRDLVCRLEMALGELPEPQRTVLTLAYFNHLTNADVAEVMGTTVSAVESLLKRARRSLREVLHDSEADEI